MFAKARCICIYVSLPIEVDTRPLIDKSLKLGKKILVPLAEPRTKQLKFYEIKNRRKDLKKGAYGILEPIRGKVKPAVIKEAELVIVPGVVFDKRNHRIGRGAGFYDRFLKKVGKKIPKVGLAFSFQVVDRVPTAKHDYRLDKVITD